MKNFNAHAYSITIRQIKSTDIDLDGLYQATIAELPDATDYGTGPFDAYQLAIETIEGAAKLYAKSNRKFPKPIGAG